MREMLDGNSTLEMLAAHADDVKYVESLEERAIIAYEGFCMMVALPRMFPRTAAQREEDIQNYGSARRILIQALKAAPRGTPETGPGSPGYPLSDQNDNAH